MYVLVLTSVLFMQFGIKKFLCGAALKSKGKDIMCKLRKEDSLLENVLQKSP